MENNDTSKILKAMKDAQEAQLIWEKISVKERIKRIKPIRDFIVNNKHEIAEAISRDTGKNIIDAMSTEVIPSSMAISFYMKKGKKFLKEKRLTPGNIFFFNKISRIRRVPFGVIAVFSPWNYPFSIPFSEVIMGLIAGNAVLLKSAHETPGVSKILADAINAADLPENLFFNIESDPVTASSTLLKNKVDKFFFTGSPAVGKLLMSQAAENLVPLCLELGGNDPMIVMDDADLTRAASGALWAGFQNCGQSCGGVERVYAHESIIDEFLEILKEKTMDLRIDSSGSPDSEYGMITTERQVETVKNQIKDALDRGAVIYAEAHNPEPENPRIISPKIITQVDHEMDVMRYETFGPVLCVVPFENIDHAVEMANSTEYGLTASVWSRDLMKAGKIAERIKAGAVTINDHLMSHGLAETPWGGFKTSSIGRSHGEIGLDEMTQPQVIVNDINIFTKKNLFWYPYSEKLYRGMNGAVDFLYGKGLKRLKGALKALAILPRIFVK